VLIPPIFALVDCNNFRLAMELLGVSCLDMEQCPAPKQSLTWSRAFTTQVRLRESGGWLQWARGVNLLKEGGPTPIRIRTRDKWSRSRNSLNVRRGVFFTNLRVVLYG